MSVRAAILGVAAIFGATACGGPEKPAETAASASSGGSSLDTSADKIEKMYAVAAAAPAATMQPNGPGDDAIGKGIQELAKSVAAGMAPEGPLVRGSLKEAAHLQADVTLQPGKCYAIVGFSAAVTDFDMRLFTPPGILRGEDTTDDNKPVIGKFPDALCLDTAITYKLDLFAEKGGGDVGAQLYSKSK